MSPLKTACGCFDLHIGTELIGWLGIFGAILHGGNTQSQQYPGITSTNHDNSSMELLASIIQIVVCGCLVGGSKKKNKALLLPWLILDVIVILTINVALLYALTVESSDMKSFILSVLIFFNLVGGYMWLIVFSLYRQLHQNTETIAIEHNVYYKTTLIPPSKV